MTSNEKERVRRFCEGDEAAFDELFAEYGGRIYRFCFRLCGRAEDAEDLAAETFAAAHKARERFEGRSSISTWLYRIAVYKWRQMRECRGEANVSIDTVEPAVQPTDYSEIALSQALAELPPMLQECFLLVKSEGMRYREAADVLGVPQGTVQYRVHEAVRMLCEKLEIEPRKAGKPASCEPVRCGNEL